MSLYVVRIYSGVGTKRTRGFLSRGRLVAWKHRQIYSSPSAAKARGIAFLESSYARLLDTFVVEPYNPKSQTPRTGA